MLIAILSDIHGNPVALDAVLADARSIGIEAYWVLGDHVAIGYSPVDVLERLSQLDNSVIVRGNTDRYVVTGEGPPPTRKEAKANPEHIDVVADMAASFAWTRGFISDHGWFAWLASLPMEKRITLPDGTRSLLVHAAPGTDDGKGLHPGMSNSEIEQLTNNCNADLVCVGHTHETMDRRLEQTRVVNPGSVSNPKSPDLRASYAILHATKSGSQLSRRYVDYDHAAVIDAVRRSHHPAAEFIVFSSKACDRVLLHTQTTSHDHHSLSLTASSKVLTSIGSGSPDFELAA